ncbi:MAG: bifunctional oligoribonuclease/PAP phosphatase NrnA [Bacteroidetes bacterium]|nr:bifunctional oligoribonuclease/PAP phosphatase NrnA [Bacteroidota bacterium]
MERLDELKEILKKPRRIVITMHQKPDGDALGSALGLHNYLIKKGHDSTVVTPTDYPQFLKWMPGNDSVVDYEKDPEKSVKTVEAAEIIFCLDFNKLNRLGGLFESVEASDAKIVMIDHHLDPDDYDDFRMSVPTASSTAELIYDLILLFGDESFIDLDIAECLYSGIMTDTGSFRFNSTTPKVHMIAAELLKKGVDLNKVHGNIMDTFSEARMRFFGYCIKEKLTILPEYRMAYIAVSAEEIRKYYLKTGDTEGLVNYPLSLDNVKFAALIIDRTLPGSKETLIKLSLRSTGSFSVYEITHKYFNGGGHKNAAGGISSLSLEDTLKKLLDLLPQYKEQLNTD